MSCAGMLRGSDMFPDSPPGRKFRHAAYLEKNIDVCNGEAERPNTRFTWPAWRSNYFSGVIVYIQFVAERFRLVVLGFYEGKGVDMW